MSNEVIKEDTLLNHLLVEGPDDAQVFVHLFRRYNLINRVTIHQKEGIDNLIASLDVELMRRAETHIGIIVDADTDVEARWKSLRHKLLTAGYAPVPLMPEPSGTILRQDGRPVVGLWLMPDNVIPGMLEDFMRLLVPANDILWPIAEDVVKQVVTKDRRFPATQEAKARIHTWLAWQEEPGKPMGLAITKKYLDADTAQVQQLINWIRTLFDIK